MLTIIIITARILVIIMPGLLLLSPWRLCFFIVIAIFVTMITALFSFFNMVAVEVLNSCSSTMPQQYRNR